MRFLSSVDRPCHPWMAMVIFPLLLLLVPLTDAQWQNCGSSGNFASNSAYQANLRLLSSNLPKKAASNTTLFATGIVGNVPDIVYALTLCRGDANASACESCVATAFQDAQQLCPYNKDAAVYYDPCMLRFSNLNFLANVTDNDPLILMNTQNITVDADSFRLFLFTLLNSTTQWTAISLRRFTTSSLDVSTSTKLYSLVQCVPDLSANECAACLQPYYQYAIQYMDGKQGGRVLGTWCTMRYEEYPFFQGNPMVSVTNLAYAVPVINNPTPGSTPVTVYTHPQQPAAGAPPPEAQTTVQQHQGRSSRKRPLWIIAVVAP